MNRRETESESVFFSRLQDLADRCRRDCAPDCTMFLDEMQCAAADAFLQRQAELAGAIHHGGQDYRASLDFNGGAGLACADQQRAIADHLACRGGRCDGVN